MHVHQTPFVGNSTQFYVQMVLRQREDVLACLRFTVPDDKPTCCIIHRKMPLAGRLTAVSRLHAGQAERLSPQKPVALLQKQRDVLRGWEVEGQAFLIAALAFEPWAKHLPLNASLLIVHVNRTHTRCLLSTHQLWAHTRIFWWAFRNWFLQACMFANFVNDNPETFCSFVGCVICHNHSCSATMLPMLGESCKRVGQDQPECWWTTVGWPLPQTLYCLLA